MIQGFQKYLVEHGCKRFADLVVKGKVSPVEDYESMWVSAYGPCDYYFTYNDRVVLYWGLNVVGKPPYYWMPLSLDEFIPSDNWEAEMNKLIAYI